MNAGARVQNDSARTLRFRRWFVALLAAVGTGVSLFAFAIVRSQDARRLEAEADRLAGRGAQEFQRTVDQYQEVLESFRTYHGASSRVERHEFAAFARRPLTRLDGLEALLWAPRVASEEIEPFEAAAREEGLDDFRIRRRGRPVAPDDEDDFFPLLFAAPEEPFRGVLGEDLAATERPYRDLLRHSRDEKQGVVAYGHSAPESLFPEMYGLLLLPVYVNFARTAPRASSWPT
jgi:CHASE1-domain containing sensor protein